MNPVKTLTKHVDLKPDWMRYLTGYIAENLGKKHDRLCGISSLPLCTGAVGKQEQSQPVTKKENPKYRISCGYIHNQLCLNAIERQKNWRHASKMGKTGKTQVQSSCCFCPCCTKMLQQPGEGEQGF